MIDLSKLHIRKLRNNRPMKDAQVVVVFDRTYVHKRGKIYSTHYRYNVTPYAMWPNKQALHRALRLFGLIDEKEEQRLHAAEFERQEKLDRERDYRELLALCQSLKLKLSNGVVSPK